MDERGQTLQDYLLGISLLLLTVAGVFGFFPEVFVPFQETVGAEDRLMADRLADEVVEVNATVEEERTVNLTALNRTLTDPDGLGRLKNRSGIPAWMPVNVTVQDEDGTLLIRGESGEAGTVYRDDGSEAVATRVRTIQAQNRSSPCADSCQVVVRVWEGGRNRV